MKLEINPPDIPIYPFFTWITIHELNRLVFSNHYGYVQQPAEHEQLLPMVQDWLMDPQK